MAFPSLPRMQESSFQVADTRLVSTPTTSAIAPTQEQHIEAIGILKDEDDGNIFAWLKLARSLGHSLPNRSDHACLTRDQVRAIAALRHCASIDVSAWLYSARTLSGSEIDDVSVSPPIYQWLLDQGHGVQPISSDASTPGPINHPPDHEPKQQGLTQGSLTQRCLTATVPPPSAKAKYYCTLCDYVRPFKNQSDWKKHEREHDTTYFCMLKGPREATPQGSQCAFCGVSNPHNDHLLEHNAQACLQGSPESFSSKRRHDMVNHLNKIHGIHLKSQGEAIAVKFKYTVEKQAWSCGFCISTFVTFNDRLSHIAIQHFERGQTIDQWDATKVIQGLLQQSSMTKAWKGKVASLSAWEVPDIIWMEDAIKELQNDLEVGPNDEKGAVDLAEAAYIACRMNWGMENQQAMAVAESNVDRTFIATSFSPNQFQARLASAPAFSSNDHQSLSAVQEFNEFSSSRPATQATPPGDYGYSSAPMAHLNDSKNIALVPSPFCPQQSQ